MPTEALHDSPPQASSPCILTRLCKTQACFLAKSDISTKQHCHTHTQPHTHITHNHTTTHTTTHKPHTHNHTHTHTQPRVRVNVYCVVGWRRFVIWDKRGATTVENPVLHAVKMRAEKLWETCQDAHNGVSNCKCKWRNGKVGLICESLCGVFTALKVVLCGVMCLDARNQTATTPQNSTSLSGDCGLPLCPSSRCVFFNQQLGTSERCSDARRARTDLKFLDVLCVLCVFCVFCVFFFPRSLQRLGWEKRAHTQNSDLCSVIVPFHHTPPNLAYHDTQTHTDP